MTMTKKKIPNFETLDQAVEFWETHSFTDYADDTEEITVNVNLPLKDETVQIELTEPIARQVPDLARRRHTTRCGSS